MMGRPRLRRQAVLGVVLLSGLVTLGVAAQVRRHLEPNKPRPDVANLRYGPHERNVLDLWKVPGSKSGGPAPVVVFFHGGGFIGGDKRSVPGWFVEDCLRRGIAVVSANYRLSRQAPYPAPMLDGARVIQFLRENARDLDIDPSRLGACGNSAGAGISLWVGMHDDLAEPSSIDPVLRRSTRLRCMGVVGAQTSYDPRVIKALVGGRAHEHVALRPLFGLTRRSDPDRPEVHRLYEDASPINHVSADDPPVILFYSEPDAQLPADARAGEGIHHPRFGAALKAMLDPLGIECSVHHHSDYRSRENPEQAMYADLVNFFARHLGPRSVAADRGARPRGELATDKHR
ncbi:MAG: alpha/beta hydrolase fold domain-containing protein [Isosphaeraceae bacterium]